MHPRRMKLGYNFKYNFFCDMNSDMNLRAIMKQFGDMDSFFVLNPGNPLKQLSYLTGFNV